MIRKHLGIAASIAFAAWIVDSCVAQAGSFTTAPQQLTLSLSGVQVEFSVVNANGIVTNTFNGPQTPSQTLSFEKFNPALGILTGVAISFTTAYSATATVNATNNSGNTIQFFADASLGHILSGNEIVAQSSPQTLSAGCTTASTCNASVPGSNSFSGTAALALPLTSFTGAGLFNLTATLSGDLGPRTIPDAGPAFPINTTISGTLSANWDGTVAVVYTYDTPISGVPEPSTFCLVFAGLAGLGLLKLGGRSKLY